MFDDILSKTASVPSLINGKININDNEIDYMIRSYAIYGAGFNFYQNKTTGFNRIHRHNLGQKLWEQMTVEEQKNEYFEKLKLDLETASKQLKVKDIIDYLLERATDPLDPMGNFYKVVLIKLGASIAEDGTIKISKELKEKLEKCELHNTRLVDLVPIDKLDLRNGSLRQTLKTPKLKLTLEN